MDRDISRKTAVITGATSGIGFATALALAQKGAYVIGVGRDAGRCEAAKKRIMEAGGAKVDFLTADLGLQKNIHALAGNIRGLLMNRGKNSLDVLINNAGTVCSWYTLTAEGIETQFAVNHLAPFLLTHLLMPQLLASPGARVLTMSSMSHRGTRINFKDIMLKKTYNCLAAYKHTKLCNVMFSTELQRRFDTGKICVIAIDPGLVRTDIGLKGTGGLISFVWSTRARSGVTPEEGAKTSIHLASAAELDMMPGVYWKDCKPLEPSRYSQREAEAKRLWEISERMCGIAPDSFGKP
ncbi:MAG: SDR family oxidoreductase [Bacillota bacterium]|nr:SDR family oxidoreductase [Bacillota bacterium]